jgi:putative spermidine/putrescine transport system ATP-binding protein
VSQLSIRSVTKRYGQVLAVDGVSLDIDSGAFLTLLGDSGCGKTTLLRIVAGFARPDTGAIWRDGRNITALAPRDRRMGFVFQSYALFPTKTVADNIGFALKVAGQAKGAIAARVAELARLMELERLLERYPHELSGGQQQRVALARALAPRPDVLLLDEPLSALDARIRAKLRQELRALVDRLGITAIYVTHDQEEALAISDRVAVMRAGKIAQIGSPSDIYFRPQSRFVAQFVGTANLVEGRLAEGGVESRGHLWPARLPANVRVGERVTVMFRPEHLTIAAPGNAALRGVVAARTFLGPALRLKVVLDGGDSVVVDRPSGRDDIAPRPGEAVGVGANPDHAVLLNEPAAT